MSTALVSMVDADLLEKAPAVDLGARIRAARLARSLTQAQLAAPADVSAAYLSRIESGDRRPSVQVIASFAETLNLSVRDLVVGFEDTDKPGKELLNYLSQLAASAAAAWLANPGAPDAYKRMTLAVSEWEHAVDQAPPPVPIDVDPADALLLEALTAAVLDPDSTSPYGQGQHAWDQVQQDLTRTLPLIRLVIAAERDDVRAALHRAVAAFDADVEPDSSEAGQ